MIDLLQEHEQAVWWIVACSALILLASVVLVPWFVIRIPADYFVTEERPALTSAGRHPLIRYAVRVLKNLVGLLLLMAGVAMLVLPGQGLLTIAVGLLLLDFPGKYKLEARIVQIPSLLRSINWLRRKANAEPLRVQHRCGDAREHS